MPSTSPVMYLSGMDKGRVQLNLSVVPTNPAATMGLDSQRRYELGFTNALRLSLLTPTTCRLLQAGAVFLTPTAVGTCSLRIEFQGIRAYLVEPSNFTWSATVSK
jgi:hypothetical protein